MSNRNFSDAIKLEIVKTNLEKNNGTICCEICGIKLTSIKECHFDHIQPFAKGGRSTFDNCQLLCVDCNLKKNDKELKDFVLEEKAKKFLGGESLIDFQHTPIEKTQDNTHGEMTKEAFNKAISDFIREKGNICKVDFSREYNQLPSIHYVRQYYGDLNNLKKAFGIEDLSYNWNRDNIKNALSSYVAQNGDISQKDLTKANKLPSIPCILNYYPEYKSFTDIKKGLCNLSVPIRWTKDIAIEYGKTFVSRNRKITQKDLRADNNLPSAQVIDRLFGSLSNYQDIVGAEISKKNEYISKDEIEKAVNLYFEGKERVVESQKVFFETFVYSQSTILKRYGSFATFCEEHNIQVLISKKAKYNKREVDDIISKWIKEGHEIPASKDLSKLGLPSRDVILKFYENWKEPFYIYRKLYDELNRY